MLDRNTKKNDMETGNENRSTPRIKVDKTAATWNPGLSIGAKASRGEGRPKKRWEDDINQFVTLEETEETRGSDLKNNDTWIIAAGDQNIQRNGKGLRKELLTQPISQHHSLQHAQPTAPTAIDQPHTSTTMSTRSIQAMRRRIAGATMVRRLEHNVNKERGEKISSRLRRTVVTRDGQRDWD